MVSKRFHFFDTTGLKESIDSLLKGPHTTTWTGAVSNELDRLAQAINNVKGNCVLDFILKSKMPSDRIVTYVNMVCDYRPHKQDIHRVRLTVGGYCLTYNDDVSSPAASLRKRKLLLSSTISDVSKGARFITLDRKVVPSNTYGVPRIYAYTFQILFLRHAT